MSMKLTLRMGGVQRNPWKQFSWRPGNVLAMTRKGRSTASLLVLPHHPLWSQLARHSTFRREQEGRMCQAFHRAHQPQGRFVSDLVLFSTSGSVCQTPRKARPVLHGPPDFPKHTHNQQTFFPQKQLQRWPLLVLFRIYEASLFQVV